MSTTSWLVGHGRYANRYTYPPSAYSTHVQEQEVVVYLRLVYIRYLHRCTLVGYLGRSMQLVQTVENPQVCWFFEPVNLISSRS